MSWKGSTESTSPSAALPSRESPTQLGPYRIIGLLGSGGLGRVYRARDERLQRDVAIKVLRDARSGNAERDARLLWEARAASALNHPNIVAVFDVGSDADLPYIVSELVEGEPLRHEVNRGPLPMVRLLSLVTQIGEGLAAAHAAGITHGDVKPDNMMVTRDGRVKIVDFGLASAIEQLASPGEASAAETATLPGLILGTVEYASPERARGAAVDPRSDQFSFGVMLFELATGVRPFKRDSPVETLAAIVSDDAPDATAQNPKVPPPLQWILDRCLAKSPADRYASTADLVLDLRAVRDRTTSKSTNGTGRTRRRFGIDRVAPIGGGIVLGVLLLAGWLWWAWRPDEQSLAARVYTPFATDPGYQGKPAWSRDGTRVAYSAEVNGVLQIFTRGVAPAPRSQVTHELFDCDSPFWSPDDRYIYYFSPLADKIALYRIASVTGKPELVLDNASSAALSPDGKMLAYFREDSDQPGSLSLWLANPEWSLHDAHKYDRGSPDLVGLSAAIPQFSPDGKQLLIWAQRWAANRATVAFSAFVAISLPDLSSRQVLQSIHEVHAVQSFSWLPDSRHIVTMLGSNLSPALHLWMADLETDRSWQITAGSATEGFPAVSRDGRIAYSQEETNFDVMRVPLDGSQLQQVQASSRDELDPTWSPTRREYAYVTDRSGRLEIWIRTADGQSDQPLVTSAELGATFALGSLAFNPDGNSIVYQRYGNDGYRLWVFPRAGTAPTRLTLDETPEDAPSWSPKGDEIAFVQWSQGHWNLVKARPNEKATVIVRDTVVAGSRPQWSPNGTLIAFQSGFGLSVVDPNGQNKPREISTSDWLTFAWNGTDKQLYGLKRSDDRVHFSLASLTRIGPGTWVERAIGGDLGLVPIANQPIRGFTWTGKDFLTSVAHVRSDIWILDGLNRPPSFLDRLWPVPPHASR